MKVSKIINGISTITTSLYLQMFFNRNIILGKHVHFRSGFPLEINESSGGRRQYFLEMVFSLIGTVQLLAITKW